MYKTDVDWMPFVFSELDSKSKYLADASVLICPRDETQGKSQSYPYSWVSSDPFSKPCSYAQFFTLFYSKYWISAGSWLDGIMFPIAKGMCGHIQPSPDPWWGFDPDMWPQATYVRCLSLHSGAYMALHLDASGNVYAWKNIYDQPWNETWIPGKEHW